MIFEHGLFQNVQFQIKSEEPLELSLTEEDLLTEDISLTEDNSLPEYNTLNNSIRCTICQKSFRNKRNLRRHELIHLDEKPFKCNDCGKTFTLSHNLATHKLIHSEEKPFKCNECGKTFTLSYNLASHKLTHSEEKPFKCDDCGMTFKRSHHLATHKLIHSEEKPFKCNDCGMTFKRLYTLASHKLTHSDEKPFKCNDCGMTFKRSQQLKKSLSNVTSAERHSHYHTIWRLISSSILMKIHQTHCTLKKHFGYRKFCESFEQNCQFIQSVIIRAVSSFCKLVGVIEEDTKIRLIFEHKQAFLIS
ncbi:Zinc finger protein [Pseudolycoriella hygida]|uniref:Zinc finger protein n=1 Tax=Pseudolycoriella hygida TaxID=35572 RepID=A0A9Q0N5P7_9DIPT|nr:Zinc finger protein [Pseudolycoriella hygida]